MKVFFGVIFLFMASVAFADDVSFFEKHLGKAPEGFEWTLCHGGFLAIRKPKNWFFKEEGPSKNGTLACFVTKEDFSNNKEFETGFTINIIRGMLEKAKVLPSVYAKNFIAKMAKETKEKGEKIDLFRVNENKQLKGFILRTTRTLLNNKNEPKLTTVHNFVVANDQTGTIYIALFESPTESWDDAWKIGEKITEQLGILGNR